MRLLQVSCLILASLSLLLTAGCNRGTEKANEEKKAQAYKVTKAKDEVKYSLTEDQTKYLWDLEHHGNILNKYGFKPLVNALVENSRDDLINILGGTSATVIEPNTETDLKFTSQLLDLSRISSADTAGKNLDAAGLADWWLAHRARFADSPKPKAKFAVKSLLPPKDDEFWRVTCIHRIWGVSRDGGPLEVLCKMNLKTYEIEKGRLSLGNWFADCEVTQIDVLKSGKTLFQLTDTSDTRIQPEQFHDNWKKPLKLINTGGVYTCDYNRDGITDMFVTDVEEDAGKMYTGVAGGKFNDETFFLKLELAKNARIANFIDIDNDGWEDVIFPDMPRIYRNVNGERFENVTGITNLPLMISLSGGTHKRVSAVIPADYDLDGDLDLYITRSVENVGSWLESLQPTMAHNQLLRNDGNWTFTDVTERTGTDGEGRSTFSAVWTDLNADRYPDLYLINEFGNGSLLVNEQGKGFRKHKLTPEQNDFGSMGLTCGDYNNDGNIDIYISNMYSKAGSRIMGNMVDETYPEEVQARLRYMVAGGELYQNNGDLKFEPVGKKFQIHDAGWAWGSSLADFNNDGWLDLYVTAGFMSRDRAKPDG